MGWFQRVFWTLAASGGAYVAVILSLTIPVVQRNATYAHKVNPTLWQNVSDVEQFGFLHHQVQPFTVNSAENVTLHAWHILPTHLYRQHEKELVNQHEFGIKPYAQAAESVGLQLMLKDSKANVVVSFHGNAGHIASSYRPATFQQVLSVSTPDRPVHLITFDYRGFGLSTGSPDEAGVIEDGIAIVSALCGKPTSLSINDISKHVTSSPPSMKPSQMILMGQSMGTFVSAATYHDWVIRLGQAPFKALLLIASFSTLPDLLESYSIKGLTPPLLSPLMQYPGLQRWVLSKIADRWEVAPRLVDLVKLPGVQLDATLMHATNDWEIPHYEGRRNWNTIMAATNGTGVSEQLKNSEDGRTSITVWRSDDGTKRLKWEKIRYGGHNRIPTSEQMKMNLYDILDR